MSEREDRARERRERQERRAAEKKKKMVIGGVAAVWALVVIFAAVGVLGAKKKSASNAAGSAGQSTEAQSAEPQSSAAAQAPEAEPVPETAESSVPAVSEAVISSVEEGNADSAATDLDASVAAKRAAAEAAAEAEKSRIEAVAAAAGVENPSGIITGQELPEGDDRAPNLALDYNNKTWNYESNGVKTVYLTFDDGPTHLTPQVLDILDQYNVKATFFVTSLSPDYSDCIRDAYQRGHSVGMHSSCHAPGIIYTSADAYFTDLSQIARVVKDKIGYVPFLMRFVGGSANRRSKEYSDGLMKQLVNDVQDLGYQYWDWNAQTGDGSDVTKEQALENALSCTEENIIMLCHDGSRKETTVEALPEIIEGFMARGYVFSAIDRSTMVVHQNVT